VGWRFYNSFGEEKSESALFVGPNTPPSSGMLWLDTDEPPSALPGTLLDVQTIAGNSEAYKTVTSGQRFTRDAAGLNDLTLFYTPPVNCWWETHLTVGSLQKLDAVYHWAYASLNLTPADVDGVTQGFVTFTQRSDVDAFGNRDVTRIFKLQAGTPYQVYALFNSQSGAGSWSYYQGSAYLWLEGKAWSR
jgi:hypothetical protein